MSCILWEFCIYTVGSSQWMALVPIHRGLIKNSRLIVKLIKMALQYSTEHLIYIAFRKVMKMFRQNKCYNL